METIIMHSSIESAIHFIKKSIYELEELGIHPNNIKILIPNFYKGIIFTYNRQMIQFNGDPENKIFCGKEILPHYKNEIVVFDEKYFKADNHFRILSLEI